MAAHAVAEGVAPDAEQPRRRRDVAAAAAQGLVDAGSIVAVVDCRSVAGRGHQRRRARTAERRDHEAFARLCVDHRILGQQGDALHEMTELAHVARPRVRAQPARAVFTDLLCVETVGSRGLLEEVAGEGNDVVDALAQTRQIEHDDGEPVVEVGAKLGGRHLLAEVALGRGDELGVDGSRDDGAEPTDRLVLDRLQQLGLQCQRARVDLVEKEGSAGSGLEQPRFGAAGVGECTLLEAEQLRLEHALGDRRAVDVDERPAGARPAVVQRTRHQSLAGTRLARDQDGRHVRAAHRIEGSQPSDAGPQLTDGRRRPDDRLDRVASAVAHDAAIEPLLAQEPQEGHEAGGDPRSSRRFPCLAHQLRPLSDQRRKDAPQPTRRGHDDLGQESGIAECDTDRR